MADEKHGEGHDEHKEHKGHGGHGGGHGGGGHAEGEHEGAPEWLISFADNVALLMGFFVILLAMNMKEPTTGGIGGKEQHGSQPATNNAMLDLVISMREAFNNPVNPSSNDPRDALLIQRMRQKKEGDAKTQGPPGDRQEVQTVRPTDYHRIGGVVTFEENSVEVDQEGVQVALKVAKELKGRKSIIEVRGHVSLSEAASPMDKGMTLAFDRALAVAMQLSAGGLSWDQMRTVAVGAGDRVKPLARSAKEHHNNQRVEIIITDELTPSDPYAQDPNAGARD